MKGGEGLGKVDDPRTGQWRIEMVTSKKYSGGRAQSPEGLR